MSYPFDYNESRDSYKVYLTYLYYKEIDFIVAIITS